MSHEYFIWMSYGVAAVVVIAEVVALRVGRARAMARIEEEKDLEAQD